MARIPNRRLLAGALASALLLQTGSASAMSLLQAYEAALQNDPTYRAAVHENDAGQQNRILGRSSLLPTVSASYSNTKNRADITSPNAFGQQTTTHPAYTSEVGAVQLRQPLLNLDGIARYQQGIAQTNYSDAVFSGRSKEVVLRVVSAYADAQYAEYQLALVTAQRDAFGEQMRVNERMFQKGEGTKTDMLETQAKFDVAEAQVIEARDSLTTARNTLAAIVGSEVTNLDPLSDNFRVLPMQPESFDEWKSIALENNAEISAQRYAVEATRQDINRNRAGHAPRLDMVASLSKNKGETLNTFNQESTVRSVGVQLNIPLYSGGYVSAATSQSVSNHEKSKSDLDAKTSQVLVELRKQYSLVLSSAARIDALVKSVNSATMLITATEQSIKGGVRINLDLLNAQQQFYTAKRDLAQARYNYLLSYLRLRNAAGTLNAEDLHKVAGYFVSGAGNSSTSSLIAPVPVVANPTKFIRAVSSAGEVKADTGSGQKSAASGTTDTEELRQLVGDWTEAWSAKDMNAYLDFYASDFQSGTGQARDAWAKERQSRIQGKGRIAVQAESPEVAVDGDAATVMFRQVYKSDRLTDDARKVLLLAKQEGKWKIKQEAVER